LDEPCCGARIGGEGYVIAMASSNILVRIPVLTMGSDDAGEKIDFAESIHSIVEI